jgi:histidinol-phosphate aminotransferase
LTFEPSNLGQAAGIGALSDLDFLKKVLDNNRTELKACGELFDRLGITYIKSFANFVTLDLGSPERVNIYSDELMKMGVFVRPLIAFGLPHCQRITMK